MPRAVFKSNNGLIIRTLEISLGNSGYEYASNITPTGLPYVITAFCPVEILRNHYEAACDLFPLAAAKARCELTPRQ